MKKIFAFGVVMGIGIIASLGIVTEDGVKILDATTVGGVPATSLVLKDGSIPMSGNLSMASNNINNVSNLNFSGNSPKMHGVAGKSFYFYSTPGETGSFIYLEDNAGTLGAGPLGSEVSQFSVSAANGRTAAYYTNNFTLYSGINPYWTIYADGNVNGYGCSWTNVTLPAYALVTEPIAIIVSNSFKSASCTPDTVTPTSGSNYINVANGNFIPIWANGAITNWLPGNDTCSTNSDWTLYCPFDVGANSCTITSSISIAYPSGFAITNSGVSPVMFQKAWHQTYWKATHL